jgi:hypothetical protein
VPRQPRSAEAATNRLAGKRQELELRGNRLGPMTALPKMRVGLPIWLAIPAGLGRRKGSVITAEKAIRRCAPARTGQMRTTTRRCERAQNGSLAIAADGGWNGGDRWHDRLRVGR